MVEDRCEVFCYDEPKVKRLQESLKFLASEKVTQIFKALADETRVKIAYCLCIVHEVCVCDIANIIGCTTATASHHLRLLRNLGLAASRKEGKLVFYKLSHPEVRQMILQAIHLRKEVNSVGN